MAIREWELHLRNDTPFRLRQVAWNLDHGVWSDGGGPPAFIEPYESSLNNWGSWHSESDGWFRGTEGTIHWRIEDSDADVLLGEDLHGGRGSCLYIHWSNPYVWDPLGRTDPLHIAMTQCPGDEQLLSPEPTQISTDYQVLGWNTLPAIDSDFGTNMLGVLSPAGPLALFTGGQVQRAWLTLKLVSVRRSAAALAAAQASGLHGENLTLPDDRVARRRPLTDTAVDEWTGSWSYPWGAHPVQIVVDIAKADGPLPIVVQINDQSGELTCDWTPESIDQTRSPVYSDHSAVTGVPLQTPGHLTTTPTTDPAILTPANPVDPDIGDLEPPRLTGSLVDEIQLNATASLQLYGLFNAANKLAGHQLRLLDVSPVNAHRRDVLLNPRSVIT